MQVKKHLLEGMSDTYLSMFMNFSAQTSANMTQVWTCVDTDFGWAMESVVQPS